MAAYSPPDVELNNSQPQVDLVDVTWAKKAIGRVARVLRGLLTDRKKVDALVQHGLLEQKDMEDVVKGLQKKIGGRPSLFRVLLRELKNFSDGADVAKRLQDLFIDDQLKRLREKLHAIQLESKSEETKKDSTKEPLTTFITACLGVGVDTRTIRTTLENLHSKDTDLVSVDAYQWCLEQLEHRSKTHNQPDSPSLQEKSVLPPKINEVYFCKEVVQNSIVACHLLEQPGNTMEHLTRIHENSFFEGNKFIPLRVDTINDTLTAAHDEGAVHQYLIASAKGTTNPDDHVVYYIAFGCHRGLREWKDNYKSFEEGLKKQQEQLPIQFILEMLWKGASVILTGFSFGGNLAQLCAVQLCSLSQSICPELLEKNLLCITFGQPIISESHSNFVDDLDKKRSRFHAIYIADDIIPRVLRCLDPAFNESAVSKSEMSEKIKSQSNPHELFQNGLSTFAMKQLITLQEYETEYVYVQEVAQVLSVSHEELHGHHSSQNSSKPTAKRRNSLSDDQKILMDAVQELRSLLRLLKQQGSPAVLPYVTYRKVGSGKLRECKVNDLALPADTTIRKDLFSKHNTGTYLEIIKTQYTRKQPEVKFEAAATLSPSKFVTPSVVKLEIHHFTHNGTAALSLEGDNLCFTYKIVLHLDKSEKEYEIMVAQKESVSSRSIQIQKISLSLPSDFTVSSDNSANNDYQECEETASVHLFTHYGGFPFRDVKVKHKKFYISCRRQQVANLSVAQVIELSFLGALLERHPHSTVHTASKRYAVIQEFLRLIVDVVPVESVFSCIANMNSDQDACQLCQMLKLAEIKPPLSLTFFINAGLAITKLRGEAIQSQDSTIVEDLFYVFFVAARKRASPFLWWRSSEPEGRYLKWFDSDISSHCHNSDMVKYLQTIVDDAIKDSTGSIPAISKRSIASLFEATRELKDHGDNPPPMTIKSPMCILKEGQAELQNLQSKVRDELKSHLSIEQNVESFTKANNTMLLEFVKKIRNGDLRTCIQIISAFMEEQVHIPISDFHLSISYWKLLKLGLGIFRKKVSKDFVAQYISVSKHIQNITDVTDHTASSVAAKRSAAANSKYAGKLHFLLLASGHHEPAPELLSSLEDSLYTRFSQAAVPIDESTPLEEIEEKWDTLFKDVDMSTVVHSHRRLVAQWLKFSLLIRKLRENLSCHTTVSIIGLVNSGKSTLVKELFKIDDVETGTRAKKRTTVPFLYSIPGVENFDVIDFPAVDDQDDHIEDLGNLLRTLSQLVVFVVNYSDAHTTKAVQWYKKLNEHALPYLICLTHGDRLYAERRKQECERNEEATPADIARATQKDVEEIKEKVKEASDSSMQCLEVFSLKMDNDSPLLKSPDGRKSIHEAGIKGIEDIGQWIVQSLEVHLKEVKTAQMLKRYLKLT